MAVISKYLSTWFKPSLGDELNSISDKALKEKSFKDRAADERKLPSSEMGKRIVTNLKQSQGRDFADFLFKLKPQFFDSLPQRCRMAAETGRKSFLYDAVGGFERTDNGGYCNCDAYNAELQKISQSASFQNELKGLQLFATADEKCWCDIYASWQRSK